MRAPRKRAIVTHSSCRICVCVCVWQLFSLAASAEIVRIGKIFKCHSNVRLMHFRARYSRGIYNMCAAHSSFNICPRFTMLFQLILTRKIEFFFNFVFYFSFFFFDKKKILQLFSIINFAICVAVYIIIIYRW